MTSTVGRDGMDSDDTSSSSRRSRCSTGISNTATINATISRNGNSASSHTVATAVTTPVSRSLIQRGDGRPGSCFMPFQG